MRLRRLDLTRYGKFTDTSIDFGPRPSSGPDLHVIFGLNEAGKSTALSGYLDLLFGIEERSRYNFLHEYAAMRVGSILELEGEEQVFTRTKQRANSLLDAEGRPVGEVALSAHLAGLSRDTYSTMFSLDDETLEAGGRAILESKGDLGHLLFTATAGLANASETLLALEAEADRLYRKHSHGTELAALKKRLVDLKGKRDEIDTLGSAFETLEAERRDATDNYNRTISERSAMLARLEKIGRLARALPMLTDYGRKTARLAEMPAMVSPARTWTRSVADLMIADAEIRARISANSAELERAAAKIAALQKDEAALAISERIRALADSRARYVSAGLDLPGRRSELRILDSSVEASLAALGRTGHRDPKSLLLRAATTGTVRSMFDQRSGIASASKAARDELAAATEALGVARERVGEERSVSGAIRARLDAALSKARDSGHVQERRQAVKLLEENTALWEAALVHLQPWSGSGEALTQLAVPTLRQVAAWRTQLVEYRTERTALAATLQGQTRAQRSLSQRIVSLRASLAAPDDAAASQKRADRNEAWVTHRRNLEAESADAFALAMAVDDAISSSRLAHAHELAEIRTATESLGEMDATIHATQKQLADIDNDIALLLGAMRTSVGGLGRLPDGAAVPEHVVETVEDLLAARARALDASNRIQAARRTLARVGEEETQIKSELLTAMNRVGVMSETSDGIEELLGSAGFFLSRQAKLDAEYAEALATVRTREEELATRRRVLEAAERREQEWLDGITEALAGTWLESGLPASAIGSVLDQLSTLSQALHDRDAMRLRVEKMEADRQAFLAEVAVLATEAEQSVDSDELEQTAAVLIERLEAAERSRANGLLLADDYRLLLEARGRLATEEAAIVASRTEILNAYGVATLDLAVELEGTLRDRDRLREATTALKEQLLSDLGVKGIEDVITMLERVDVEALAVERLDLEQRLGNIDRDVEQHLARKTRAVDRLDAIGGDSAVARLDAQRRTVLLEIEDTAARYLRLRLGILAAGDALRVYRERHRSAMMARASDAFALMTRGHYSSLATQPIKGGEVLIAVQPNGASKIVDALSKGARFQLYLALRLAGYEEFAKVRPPVPFVADDIMETFDHVRSEEVFKLFGDMASVGQVIYLTHHRHLCEIARAVVPGVTLHELG